jgi:phage host-nuclease inhibitor protein Gam
MEGTALGSWEDVDSNLREICEIERELQLQEAALNEGVDRLKEEAKVKSAPHRDRKKALELAVKEFCEANRAEFAKSKSRRLTFGTVGFRLSTKIMIRRMAETLQALKDLKLNQCIRIKEEVDKEAMKALTDETLAEVGAARKTENAFGYELDMERLNKAA